MSKKAILRVVLYVLVVLFSKNVLAVTNTWIGGTGVALNWQTAGNWDQGHAPTAGEDVVFNTAGTITFTTGLAANVSLNSLTISQGSVTIIGAAAYTMTLGGNVGDDFTISNGASLTLSTNLNITMAAASTASISGTFTISSSRTWTITSATTCTINTTGSIVNSGTITGATAAILIFEGASTYYHSLNGGTIPTSDWNGATNTGTSTCYVTGMVATAPAGLNQNFYNLTWNCASQTGTADFNGTITIQNNLLITTTNSGVLSVGNGSGHINNLVTVSGSFTQNAGTFHINKSSSTGYNSLTVTGTTTINAGTFAIHGSGLSTSTSTFTTGDFTVASGAIFDCGLSSNSSTLNFKGNFAVNGTGIFKSTSSNPTINFNGSGSTQTYYNATGSANKSKLTTWVVSSGAVLQLASDLYTNASATVTTFTVDGTLIFGTGSTYGTNDFNVDVSSSYSNAGNIFYLSSGGVLKITSTGGISQSSTVGNILTSGSSARYSINSGGIFHYIGDANQSAGNALPTSITGQLIINNTAGVSGTGVSLSQATTVSGTVTLTAGILTTTSTNLLTITNTATTAISNGSASTFVSGPLKWSLSTTAGDVYQFPLGKPNKFLPLTYTGNTVASQSLQAEASTNYCGGSISTPASSYLAGEYWSVKYTQATTVGYISLGRTYSLGNYDIVTTCATLNGTYQSLGGSIAGNVCTATLAINNWFTVTALSTKYYTLAATGACSTYSGTITVGPAATFNSLTHGLAILKSCGYTGNIVLELQSDYLGTSDYETFPLTVTSSGSFTPSSTKTVTIRPASGVSSSLVITGSPSDNIIDLNAVTYITFDGRPGGTGTNQYLSIINTGTSSGSAVRFINDASYNTIKYTFLQSIYGNESTGIIHFSNGSASGNSNNTIDHCVIDGSSTQADPTNTQSALIGVYSNTTTGTNSSNTLRYNEFRNIYCSADATHNDIEGIYLNAANSAWTISYNRFYDEYSRTVSSYNGNYIGIKINSGDGYTISNNLFAGQDSTGNSATPWTITCTGSYIYTFVGMDLTFTAGATANEIQGNTIKNIKTTSYYSSSFYFKGILVNSGSANIGNTSANTIGSNSVNSTTYTNASIQCIDQNGTTTTAIINAIEVASANTVVISNNIIGGFATSQTAGRKVRFTGISTSGVGTFTINSNVIGSTTTSSNIVIGYSGTTGVQEFHGISNASSGVTTISSNTVQNIDVYGTGASLLYGINNTGGADGSSISSNTLSSLSLVSVGTTGVFYGIYQSAVATMTVGSNTVKGITINNGVSLRCIAFSYGTSSSKTTTISNNTIGASSAKITSTFTNSSGGYCGIYISSNGNTFDLTGNYIGYFEGTSTSKYYNIEGVYTQNNTGSPLINLNGNTIEYLQNRSTATASSPYNSVTGINIASTSSSQSIIKKNIVRYLSSECASNNSMRGISLSSTNNYLANNLVHLTNTDGTSTFGVKLSLIAVNIAASTTNYIYQNTFTIGGTDAGTNGTGTTLKIGNSSTATIYNNILQMARSGTFSDPYCVYLASNNSGTWTLDGNYYVNTTTLVDGLAQKYFANIKATVYTVTTFNNASYGGSNSTYTTSALTVGTDAIVNTATVGTGLDLSNSGTYPNCQDDIYGTVGNRATGSGVIGAYEAAAAPLPVTLAYVGSHCLDDKVLLEWITASEKNNDYFEILKSRDGKNWSFVSKISGTGNSINFNHYELSDYTNSSGYEYYRIKQVDYDGVENLLATITTFCNDKFYNKIEVYPNPSNGNLTLNFFNNQLESDVRIIFIDQNGRIVYNQELPLVEGQNTIKLFGLNLAAGVYSLYLTDRNHETEKVKVVFY